MLRVSAFVSVALAGTAALGQSGTGLTTERAGNSSRLEAPSGGWRAAGLLEDPDKPKVAYPPNLIDRGAQRGRTLITGRLAGLKGQDSRRTHVHEKSAHQLVVNGNAMPLYTDGEGQFARPYAFGPGSNSIELRGPGGPVKRVQFYETRGNGPRAALRVICAWDDNQAEIDMHIITPDGQHAFWAAPALNGGGGLDVDSVDGAGPEMFSISAPRKGNYQVWVNYWGNFGSGGYHFDQATRQKPIITATFTFVFNENTANERRETLVLPLRRIGDLMWVKTVQW
jgi:uncharacterized protein YfaP (DUF2135 family)